MTKPIATLDDIKTYTGITTNNQDALLKSLIPGCLAAIGAFCNRVFPNRTVTEYRDGNGSSRMQLANYPVTSFSSLTIDGRTIPASVNGGPGYVVFPGTRRIVLNGYTFFYGNRNVVMTFNAGFGDDAGVCPWPDDLKLALIMFVVTRAKERDRLGIGSKGLAGESVSFSDATSGTSGGSQGIPSAARIVLENYINVVPEGGQ